MEKRIFKLLLSLSIVVAMFSVNVGTLNATTVSVPTDGVTDSFNLASGNVIINSDGVYVINQLNFTTAKTMNTITINSNATVYLDGVNIEVNFTSGDVPINKSNPINITGAYTVDLYLVDGSTNTLASQGIAVGSSVRSGSGKAAIHVPSSSTLNIDGNTGVLNATGAEGYNSSDSFARGGGGAGIGGNGGYYGNANAEGSGTLIINGGVINAIGGANAGYWGDGGSGIGAGGKGYTGSNGSNGPVTLAGGTVTATGGNGKSSGSSGYGIGGDLTFQNGLLIAKSGTSGAILRPAIEKTPVSLSTPYQWRVNAEGSFVTFPTTAYTFNINQTYVEFDQAPILSAGSVTRTNDTKATIRFTSNEAGSYYYKVVDDNASEPTIDTSESGTEITTDETTITDPIGLTAGEKDIYIVVKDTAGNISNALKIDIAEYTNTAVDAPRIPAKHEATTVTHASDSSKAQTRDLSYLVAIPEQWMDNTTQVEFWLDSAAVTTRTVSSAGTLYTYITPARNILKSVGSVLMATTQVDLMQRVTQKDGTMTSAQVDQQYIHGNFTIRLPIPANLLKTKNLGIVYIEADTGLTANLASKIVVIDGVSYIEFQNNRSAVYGFVSDKNNAASNLL